MSNILLSDLIYIKENCISNDQCDKIIEEYESRIEHAEQEIAYNPVNDRLEPSTFQRIELIPNSVNFNIVHKATNEMIDEWINYLNTFKSFSTRQLKEVLRFSHLHRVLKYSEGQSIHAHTDFDETIHASCTICLNDHYEGGDFVFWNGRYKLDLKKGDAAIWPADPFWVHEVLPVTKGSRYSTNTFIQTVNLADSRNIWNIIDDMTNRSLYNPYIYPNWNKI